MLNKYTVQLMALGIIGSFAATAVADDSSALIDALVKKGVLKTKEAEQIRAQIAKSGSHSSAGKLDLDSSVKSLALSGDVRVRYSYGSVKQGTGNDPVTPGPIASMTQRDGDSAHQTNYALRLRINADYKLSDDFFAGFGLRTDENGANNDNSTMGNGFDNHGIGIHRAFLGWNPTPGVSLIAGKQANPFYTTDLVWDEDINPSGFTQSINLNKTLGVSGIDLTLVSGQFVVADNDESQGGYPGANHVNRDAFLWQTQLVAGIDLGGAKLTIAPGYLSTNGAAVDNNPTSTGYRYLNDVQVLLLPGDVSGEVAGIKAKFEWDFAYNFAGRDRAIHNSSIPNPRSADKLAWLLGVRLGENKKKGDWSALVNYRRNPVGALPQGLGDNEFAFADFNETLNMQGFKIGAAYNVGDSATVGVNYFKFDQQRSEAPYTSKGYDKGELLQLEVGVKF